MRTRSLIRTIVVATMAAATAVTLVALAPAAPALPDRAATAPAPATKAAPTVKLVKVVSGLAQPTDVASPPGSSDLYIAQKCGVIKVLRGGTLRKVGSLKSMTRCDEERGVIALAFDPDFANNHWLFVDFVKKNKDIQIGRFEVVKRKLVMSSYQPIISIRHRQSGNHNGGKLVFDNDGLLYISTGDGGGHDNQFGHAQDHGSMLGKILRIDVRHGKRYRIPADNPLVGKKGHPEIWGIGLRNPWRMALDPLTDQLWIGDVGQDKVEEVDAVEAVGGRLLNFGWSRYEGRRVHDSNAKLRGGKLVMPRYTYRHPLGEAIIGGAVYRGSSYPSLQGYYVYGDIEGWIGGFDIGNESSAFTVPHKGLLMTVSQAGGELYAGYADGKLFRITAVS
ncbi:MAG: PQQ-dependent sugar dehydrogenase [Nocardioidaceae bacterium]